MSISNAVDLWRSLEAAGNDPLLMAEYAAPTIILAPIPSTGGRALEEMAAQWLAACRAFDEISSMQILSEAFAQFTVEEVCLQLILQGMRLAGQGWYEGEVSEEQERFAMVMARRRLEALLWATPAPTRPQRILAGAAPGEKHDLVLLAITLLLRRRGWDVLFLGAGIPLNNFRSLLDPTRFDLAIISAEQLFTAAHLRQVALYAQAAEIPLLYGGRVFEEIPELRQRIPGYYLGPQLEAIPGAVAQTLAGSLPEISAISPDEGHQNALAAFEEQYLTIDLAVKQRAAGTLAQDLPEMSQLNLSRDIRAALALGDLDYLKTTLDWMVGLFKNRGAPPELFAAYLEAYSQAAAELLTGDARRVAEWLEQFNLE